MGSTPERGRVAPYVAPQTPEGRPRQDRREGERSHGQAGGWLHSFHGGTISGVRAFRLYELEHKAITRTAALPRGGR